MKNKKIRRFIQCFLLLYMQFSFFSCQNAIPSKQKNTAEAALEDMYGMGEYFEEETLQEHASYENLFLDRTLSTVEFVHFASGFSDIGLPLSCCDDKIFKYYLEARPTLNTKVISKLVKLPEVAQAKAEFYRVGTAYETDSLSIFLLGYQNHPSAFPDYEYKIWALVFDKKGRCLRQEVFAEESLHYNITAQTYHKKRISSHLSEDLTLHRQYFSYDWHRHKRNYKAQIREEKLQLSLEE
ncbi:MAG: hypothetical protein JJT94_16220 [Bernardetiaceae bacterium]|nr:hypothetical protein [Bernardetiaceae bacterium]